MLTQNRLQQSLSLILLACAAWLIHGFIPALLWAVVIAISTWPLRTMLARKSRLQDTSTAIIMTSSVAILLFLPIVYALILAASDLGAITNWIVSSQKAGIPIPPWLYLIPNFADQAVLWWAANLTDPESLSALMGSADMSWIKSLIQQLGSQATHRLITLVFTIVSLFFLYKTGNELSDKGLSLIRKMTGDTGKRYALQAATAIRGTVNGVVLVGLMEGLAIGISYWLADVPHAAILGLSTGALAMIPFAAPLLFTGVATFLLIQGHTAAATSVFIFGLLVLSIGDHVVRPKIIGSSVELPFLWVLFGILGGVEVLGLIGLFLGPALMALVMMLWHDMTESEN
jgi:predicted PurR-regulated permease PerM